MKTYIISVYKAKDGFRWRMKARNGKIVADSGEAYKKLRSAFNAAQNLCGASIIFDMKSWVECGKALRK